MTLLNIRDEDEFGVTTNYIVNTALITNIEDCGNYVRVSYVGGTEHRFTTITYDGIIKIIGVLV